jgi:hypothetical protein
MNATLIRLHSWCLPDGRPGPALFALVSLAFVLTVPAWITPCFIEGDNDAIADFAAHGFPVPYAGILFTTLLHWGYSAAPSFGWYAATLYAGHVLSLSLWLALLWRVFRPVWFAVAMSLVFMLYELRMLVFLDYTATSVMLCASAMAWAFLDVLERHPGRLRPLLWGLVFMLGMWVRPQGATGALAFLLPAGLWVLLLALRGRPTAAELRRLAVVALLFFAPALADLAADAALRALTMTTQQAQYDAFNAPRGRFFRLPRVDKFRLANDGQVLDALHWDRSDMLRVLSWTMLDERKYTPEAMQALTSAAAPKPATWKQYHAELWQRLAPPDPYLLLLLAALPLLLLALWRRPWPALLGLLLAPWAMGLVCYMSLHYAFQYRVEFPYLSAAAFMGLVLAGWSASMLEERKPVYSVAAALCFVIACAGVYQVTRAEAEDGGVKVVHADLFTAKLETLQKGFAGSVILAKSGNGLPFKDLDPRVEPILDVQPIQLGWSTFSPRFYQQIGALGVQHAYEVVDALVDRPDAYILGPRDWATELSAYLSDPRGVQAITVARFPDGTRLMRFVRSHKP